MTKLTVPAGKLEDLGSGVVKVTVDASGGASVSEITDIPTAETDDTLVLHPDGAGGVEWGTDATGGGGGSDAVADVFGTPDSTYEFDTSSLAGLTALGSGATTENADTTIPGCYFIKESSSGINWVGRYVAASPPFTVICKLADAAVRADYNVAGLVVGASTPTELYSCTVARTGRNIVVEKFTNLTTWSATYYNSGNIPFPVYLAIRVNSSTDIDALFSFTGYLWTRVDAARNPSITIGSAGFGAKAENASKPVSAAFDFVRVWNSALTFPGV